MAVDNLSDLGSSIVTTHADTTPIYLVVLKDWEDLSALQERQLNEAHELLKSHAAVAATSKENALKFPVGGIRYVIPYFDGELYQHLVQRNASIYGPLAIIQCLMKNRGIPISQKPLFAFYCSNINGTGTGLNDGERANIDEKIVQLGGLYSGTMTSKTTHLFAHICDPKSEKYQRAVKDKILIVSPAWVDFAYEAARHEELIDCIPLGNFMIQKPTVVEALHRSCVEQLESSRNENFCNKFK